MSTSKSAIPVLCVRQVELQPSGCLAAWVVAEGEGVGGPGRRQQAPAAEAQQGGGAQGPEEAWRKVQLAAG